MYGSFPPMLGRQVRPQMGKEHSEWSAISQGLGAHRALGRQGARAGTPPKAGCVGTPRPTEQLAGLDVDGHVLKVLAGNTTNGSMSVERGVPLARSFHGHNSHRAEPERGAAAGCSRSGGWARKQVRDG